MTDVLTTLYQMHQTFAKCIKWPQFFYSVLYHMTMIKQYGCYFSKH